MCLPGGGGGSSAPPPRDTTAEARRRDALKREQAEASRLKEENYQERVSSVYGRRGRRSLLAGAKGGRGFEIESGLMSKQTLGA